MCVKVIPDLLFQLPQRKAWLFFCSSVILSHLLTIRRFEPLNAETGAVGNFPTAPYY